MNACNLRFQIYGTGDSIEVVKAAGNKTIRSDSRLIHSDSVTMITDTARRYCFAETPQ